MRPKRFPAPELKSPTRDSMTTIFTESVAIHQIQSTSPLLTQRKSPALLAFLLSSDMPSFRHSQQQKKKKSSTAQARPCGSSRAHERALSLSLSLSLDPLSCLLRLSRALSLSVSLCRCWLAPSLFVASDVCTTVWAERTQQSAKLEAFLKTNLGAGSFFL